MARIAEDAAPVEYDPQDPYDAAFGMLSQMLNRMSQNILHPDSEREHRLRASEYERVRVEANLEYARSMLTKLEQDVTGIQPPARKLHMQDALRDRRVTLEALLDRLQDFRHMAIDSDESSSGDEDLLGDMAAAATPSESAHSASADTRDAGNPQRTTTPPVVAPAPAVDEPTQTTQSLRARSANAPQPAASAAEATHSSARAALFANRRRAAPPQTSTATAEALLDQQRAEQDALSESILRIAGALKASSQRFSSTLEADKELLGRAGEGMDKTEQSMDAARGRMGALRRMTEGKGWWGRMMLFAWVYGMMVALLLLVFVMPKLRF